MWGMDILGPFPMATGQRRFVIVAIDYFTKWIEAEALTTITASKCEEFFWKNVVCHFRVLKVLITDNGKQFNNSSFRSFCEGLSIGLYFTSVAHPQSNGQTENMNHSILQGLKRKLDDSKGTWVDELPKALWAYRTTPHSVTGETPFLLCSGIDAQLPVEVGLPTIRVLQFSEAEKEENLRGNLDLLDDVRAQALDRMISTKQRVARYYNRRVPMRIFRVGDLVLRKLEVSDPKAAVRKLSPNWEGPYKVSKVTKLSNQIHILHLKVFDLLVKEASLAFDRSFVGFSITGHVHRHREPVLHLAAIVKERSGRNKRAERMGERTPSTRNSEIGAENSLLADLTSRLSQIMNQTPTAATQETLAAPIGIKLDDTNYGLWSPVVEMYISGKDKLGYINGDLPQPQETDPSFRKWRTKNAVVKSWLINSMDPKLISNYIRFPTAKAVWDAIATTYFDGADTSQVYDLKRKVTRMRQGEGSIETYYNNLQGLWREIDFRRPNPMKCEFDIEKYNSILQEDRVYTFLDGLDDRLDNIQGDVLQLKPFPTVEQAYAHVRREDLRQSVMLTKDDIVHSAVMISKGQKSQQQPSLQLASNGKHNFSTKPKSQGEEVGCTHCGHPKHNRDTCFKLHGYPEWWHDLKAKKKRDVGRAALMNTGDTSAAAYTEPQLSLIPQQGVLPATANTTRALDNPGATDHMTFDAHDFIETSQQKRTCIANANGDLRNKKIIGRGTKREGLYYMDDLSIGQTNTAHGTNDKERQIWNHKKGYRCYDPSTRRLYTTMDGEKVCEEQNMWEGWPGFDSTTPAQCEEVTIDANKAAQLLSQDAPKTQSGVMKDDVTGSICGQEQSIQSTEEEHTLDSHVLPNSEILMLTQLLMNLLAINYLSGIIVASHQADILQTIREIGRGDDEQEITSLQEYLATEFEMKNLGGLKYFLGIEVSRSTQGIFLSQRKYVLDLLAETGMLECKPADTPIVQNHGLREHQAQIPTNKERYQRLVGKLIYLSHTRPDIAFAVSLVSQFMHNPSKDHMNAVIRILQYLKSSPGKGLMFRKHHHLDIDGYTDADWAGNATDRRSTSGYFKFVGGNLVTWRSKKQNVVALSSAEAEFRGMAKGLCELLWLKVLLAEIGYSSKSSMNMFCDNKSAIQIAENPVQHDRTKHVEVDRHFIKEKLEAKIIRFPFVKSEEQLADILTKAVSSKVFHNSLDKLDIRDIYAPT
ncbi:hypothetical protein RJ639_020199 [Escallonia herrerae]|uniref:Integrase catalytic domain-containing protein n=1 Tax=Escallonia herrerae TaxID=1293975 RepID=A0AA89AJV1_9ASTE|nr:hypothetical protein RJ639_020199 [Escallonia herrerae]